MRVMSEPEQARLLKTIASELWGASTVNVDNILYGTWKSCEASGKEYRSVQRIMEAVPSDIRDEYNQSLRKTEADKLREKADAIERGE